jgi:hypothetical protein
MYRKVLSYWLKFLVGCPLPPNERLSWKNELVMLNFPLLASTRDDFAKLYEAAKVCVTISHYEIISRIVLSSTTIGWTI